MSSPLPGGGRRVRGRYDVLEIVGRGGQGTVAKAFDTRHDRLVALKIRRVPQDPLDAEHMLHEVRTLLQLSPHPGLPLARDDFVEGDQHVLVLDWVDGIDLGRVLASDGAPGLPAPAVLRWAAQVAEALTHLHGHDPPIVHGDVKPANLVLDQRGRVVCVDLGASSVPGRTHRGGTPGFRAPEVAAGATPAASADVYGLAATLFTLLTGEAPSGVLPDWEGIEPARAERLEAALRKGLAIDPARRPSTVGELVELVRAGEADTVPTGIVTVMATDVVGLAPLWDARPLDVPAALARHHLIVDRVVERHGGRRLEGSPDGHATWSVFTRAAPAAQAAVALNGELVGACDPDIQVRVGLGTGPLSAADGHGPTADRAALVRDLAGAGQVLLAATTAGLVAAERIDGVELVPLGPHDLGSGAGPEAVAALSAAGLDVPPDPSVPPFPGLLPFTRDEADVYVGRDDAVAALRALAGPGRVVAVLGASGSGKSSLLRAGLMPHLDGATVCTPGAHPLAAWAGTGPGMVIVDQLEELVTACDDAGEQRAFVERLCAHPAGVVVGLRADALDRLAPFPKLADAVAAHHVLLAPMRPDQLRAAVEVPAARRGLWLEPGLVELVLADAGTEPGALPLVAHAMRETWLRREGRELTVAGYAGAGRVHGAIAASGEAVYDRLDAPGRDALRSVLLRMVQPGDGTADSRRRVDLEELRGLGERTPVDALIDQLAAARLVTVDGGTVQPAHEALLRAWPRLSEWIGERRDDLHRHRHLTTAAEAWAATGDPSELYRGGRLDGLAELEERSPFTDVERAFMAASRAARDEEDRRASVTHRRLRRLLAGVALALVVALIAVTVAVVQLGRTSDERDRADAAGTDAEVARLAAEARAAAPTRPDLALLLAIEANRRQDSLETQSALLGALTAHPQLVGKLHGIDSGLEAVVWSPDGRLLAAPTSDSTGTLLWDGDTLERSGDPLVIGDAFQLDFDAAFTPDSSTLVVIGAIEERTQAGVVSSRGAAQVWDVRSRTLRAAVPLALAPESVAAVDDGHVVVTGLPIPGSGTDGEPEWTAATQTIDLATDTAGPVEPVADQPLAAASTPEATLVVTAEGTLVIRGTTADPSAAITVDVQDLVGPDEVTAVAYDPARSRVAIATVTGAVVLAEIQPTAPTSASAVEGPRIEDHADVPSALGFSPDGTLLAVGGFLGSTRLIDTATGLPSGPPLGALTNQVNAVAFSPDGTRLAVGGLDGTGSVWRLDATRSIGRPLGGHTDAVTATMPRPDGETLLTASFDGTVVARPVSGGPDRWRTDTGEPIWSAALDPTGSRVAVGGAAGRLEVLSADDGGSLSGPAHFDDPVEALAWSPTEPVLAVGADRSVEPGHGLVFVDSTTLRPTGAAVTTAGGSAVGLAFSPDGSRLAVVLDNNLVRLVDMGTRTLEPGYLESVDVPFTAVAWSPDGRWIATGTAGGTVQLWDAVTLTRAAPAGTQSAYPVRGLAFSPDSARLASTSELATSQVWDVATGAPIGGALVGGDPPITIASIPEPDRPEVPFVPSWSADRRTLFVGSDAPMVWSLDPATWRAEACAIAGRELTDVEWARYLPGESPRDTCPA